MNGAAFALRALTGVDLVADVPCTHGHPGHEWRGQQIPRCEQPATLAVTVRCDPCLERRRWPFCGEHAAACVTRCAERGLGHRSCPRAASGVGAWHVIRMESL